MEREKNKKDLPDKNSFAEQVELIVKNLNYISETDSDFYVFTGEKTAGVSMEEILKQTKKDPPVEEKSFYDFFERLTEQKDWFGDEEKKTTEKYLKLKNFLAENLIQKRVFRIGKIKIDIYIVGLDADNYLKGVWTQSVET